MSGEFIFDSDDFITFCSEFENIPIGDLTDSLLEVNLQDLNDRWSNLRKSYKSLCTKDVKETDKDLIESARGKYTACMKSYHSCKSKIFDLQRTLVAPSSPILPQYLDHDSGFGAMKLPPCDTEDFHGGYEEWPSFRDMFTAVYIDHPKLSPVQKLYHLRLKVKGQAAGIVRKYKLCGQNFSLAWDALRSRYENRRILVDNQLKILLSLETITSENSSSIQHIQSRINDCLSALRAQDISTADWDPILVYMCSTKLPHETLSLWEQSLTSHRELPKWSEMDNFLSNRYEVVERLDSIHGTKPNRGNKINSNVNTFSTESVPHVSCKVCGENHPLKSCKQFLDMNPFSRNQFVSQNKICLNCLSYGHLRRDCKSKYTCSQCKRNHHSLLHFVKPNDASVIPSSNVPNESCTKQNESDFNSDQMRTNQLFQTSSHFNSNRNQTSLENTLLPTVMVTISHKGDTFRARGFLDQGSEKSFISTRLQQRLQLPMEFKKFQIRGMGGQVVANSKASCKITLFSESHDERIDISAILVPKITSLLPSFFIPKTNFPFEELRGIDLADPEFHSPGPIDLLLGCNIMPRLLVDGVKRICNSLIAQATIFGWVISGPMPMKTTSSFSIQVNEMSDDIIGEQLKRFWEQEEVPHQPPMSSEDIYCEDLFQKTTVRNSEGRYIVKLPFKPNFQDELVLGASRSQALVQYLRMEQSLKSKPKISDKYNEVLNEYITLGHMEPSTSQERICKGTYTTFYLPHHAVLRPESVSTKVRVVFNASKRTNSGNSLNDVLHVGPTLQLDLMTLILRWRLYRYVFSGDIEKMYRQILVHMDDIAYQKILFRPSPTSPIKDFVLKTVTFGVNSAPYLAIRSLLQLARESANTFPLASKIIERETYVDDILSGAHEPKPAIESLSQLIQMLQSAGFPLKKITSNCAEVLDSVPQDSKFDSDFLKLHETSSTKTLGIQWNALEDTFSYSVKPPQPALSVSRRVILSESSKLYDPAGWISPILIRAKILYQQLWLEGKNWDDCVLPSSLLKWNEFVTGLKQISLIKIPRWVNFSPHYETQIHGFCDASEKAYCATVYIRVKDDKFYCSHLLVSKTKVAPIDPISLPRLELCGAVLLSRLINHIVCELPIENFELFLWCDSTIVLGWLRKPPSTWKTYVANRVAKIIRYVGNTPWRHVRSNENPADLGSRGCSPVELVDNTLWWNGPSWLQKPSQDWPRSMVSEEDLPDIRRVDSFHIGGESEDILERFSRWDKAIRVIAYVFRFLDKASRKINVFASQTIAQSEFNFVKQRLILLSQQRYYSREYNSLLKSNKISTKSPLYPLNPFIDNKGLIRINGRLANSNLSYNECHPVVLSTLAKYTTLFISFIHNFLLHAENNLMMRTIREEYYISRLRSAIKKCIRSCKTCVIYKQHIHSQLMAALPEERSTFSLPFVNIGLDFAGPFSIKTSTLRQAIYQKGYVCVFVCFSTKAIHLELCSALSSDAFLAAFTRFVGRRGLPKKVMSDNGTNFVGAERMLRYEFSQFLKIATADVAEKYVAHGLEWAFIPPGAPHMGGLWEAGVKSFKTHFKKVAQNKKYTFEEFSTLLTRIEAVLNSRPLSQMTDDPHELLALTPGHFLRGAPLVTFPEVVAETIPLTDRWENLKSLQHQFARRWKDEYLIELQRRYKWQQPKENIKIGQLVVVKDDQLPPCEWRLGRVKRVHEGRDGLVRVADINTSSGTITRAITKLCFLPSP